MRKWRKGRSWPAPHPPLLPCSPLSLPALWQCFQHHPELHRTFLGADWWQHLCQGTDMLVVPGEAVTGSLEGWRTGRWVGSLATDSEQLGSRSSVSGFLTGGKWWTLLKRRSQGICAIQRIFGALGAIQGERQSTNIKNIINKYWSKWHSLKIGSPLSSCWIF